MGKTGDVSHPCLPRSEEIRNMRAIYKSSLALLAVSVLLCAAAGCGRRGAGSVHGEVKYQGQPLPDGNIAFLSQVGDKQAVRGKITDGKYSVNGVPAGP